MDDIPCRQFFLEPVETYHRQYEALRAFFVQGRQLKEIAGAVWLSSAIVAGDSLSVPESGEGS
jgi:hypothetical protein